MGDHYGAGNNAIYVCHPCQWLAMAQEPDTVCPYAIKTSLNPLPSGAWRSSASESHSDHAVFLMLEQLLRHEEPPLGQVRTRLGMRTQPHGLRGIGQRERVQSCKISGSEKQHGKLRFPNGLRLVLAPRHCFQRLFSNSHFRSLGQMGDLKPGFTGPQEEGGQKQSRQASARPESS